MKKKAFAAITTVIIITFIGMSVTVFILSLFLISINNQSTIISSEEIDYISQSCTEIALEKIRKDPTYQGSETVTFLEGDCSIDIMDTQEIYITAHHREQERNTVLTFTINLQHIEIIDKRYL